MSKNVDDILAGELARLVRGPLAGFLTGLVARRMPNNIGEVSVTAPAPAADVLRLACAYFSVHGRVLEVDATEATGVIGGGSLNLNPVHVAVQVEQSQQVELSQQVEQSEQSEIHATTFMVRATAREGLIKQHAGEKSAALVAEYIDRMARSQR